MRLIVCGVRGSTPSPGPATARIGGNTSCLALAHDGEPPSLILDAGTGLRNVGAHLAGQPFRGTILCSHVHLDHIQGLPFFGPGDRPGSRVDLRIPSQPEGCDAGALMERVFSPPIFPVRIDELDGDWTVASYDEGTFTFEGFEVIAREVPHPGGRAMGLRVSDGSATVAYLPDHGPQLVGRGPHGRGALHAAALALAGGADLLIHDATFDDAELERFGHYGHSTPSYAADLAAAAAVPHVLTFHHGPGRADDDVEALAARAATPAVTVRPAIEHEVFDLR